MPRLPVYWIINCNDDPLGTRCHENVESLNYKTENCSYLVSHYLYDMEIYP